MSTYLSPDQGPTMGQTMLRLDAEVASAFAILGHMAGALPAIATLFAIIWYMINVWESQTVKRLLRRK